MVLYWLFLCKDHQQRFQAGLHNLKLQFQEFWLHIVLPAWKSGHLPLRKQLPQEQHHSHSHSH